jgi:flagellar basal-body rod protein FlgG
VLRVYWNSKSSMIANQEKLDSISNNLANVNTDGYKRVDVSFKDLVYETLNRTGYPVSDNRENEKYPFTGTGVRTSEWVRDKSQGNLYETKKATDLAIDGEGYFKVTKSNGEVAYTRAGKFDIDAMGRLVDSSGNRLSIDYNNGFSEGNVKLTEGDLSVSEDGRISTTINDNKVEVGKIPLYNAIGDRSMRSIGDNLYVAVTGVQMYEASDSNILQGLIEGSNVDMANEMTELLITQRAFELGSRGIKTADEMWGMANNLRAR